MEPVWEGAGDEGALSTTAHPPKPAPLGRCLHDRPRANSHGPELRQRLTGDSTVWRVWVLTNPTALGDMLALGVAVNTETDHRQPRKHCAQVRSTGCVALDEGLQPRPRESGHPSPSQHRPGACITRLPVTDRRQAPGERNAG